MAANLGCASNDIACACSTDGFDVSQPHSQQLNKRLTLLQLTPCEISCSVKGQWSASDNLLCDTATTPNTNHATRTRRAREDRYAAVADSTNIERDPAAAADPKWSPLACTAWGVTCAHDHKEVQPQSEVQDAAQLDASAPVAEQPSERDAAPAPTWSPMSCTAWGVTCAKDNSSSPQEIAPSATTFQKRVAAPTSGADAADHNDPTPTEHGDTSSGGLFARFVFALRSIAGKRNAAAEPTWSPLSCTAWGVTCAHEHDTEIEESQPEAKETGIAV